MEVYVNFQYQYMKTRRGGQVGNFDFGRGRMGNFQSLEVFEKGWEKKEHDKTHTTNF